MLRTVCLLPLVLVVTTPGSQACAQRLAPPQRPPEITARRGDLPHEFYLPAAGPEAASPAETPAPLDLTLEEARAMVLGNSRILQLAALAVQEKRFARVAASKDYYPKVIGLFSYFHFDKDLGTVVTRPVLGVNQVVPIFNQDSPLFSVMAAQPVTALWQVREAVNLAAADERIASSNVAKARRELLKGLEQLYSGLYIAGQGDTEARTAVAGAEKLVAAQPAPENRLALLQARQASLQASGQVADLTGKLDALLGLPLNTQLNLAEPSPIVSPVGGPEQAIDMALASSPEIREAANNVDKAAAAVRLAQIDFYPSAVLYGGYVNQNTLEPIQDEFGFLGVTVNHTLFEWGKKNDSLHQRQVTYSLALRNLEQTRETVRGEALAAYGAFAQAGQALKYADETAAIYREMKLPADPTALRTAVQARATAEAARLQAEVAYRSAYAELMAVTGQIECLLGEVVYEHARRPGSRERR